METFYAVPVGRNPGVYTTWVETQRQVSGFPCAVFKKFYSYEEAQRYVDEKIVDNDCRSDVVATAGALQIFTDGSKTSLSSKLGYGVYVVGIGGLCGPVPPEVGATANAAEIYAIYRAICLVRDTPDLRNKIIEIYSDSNYAVQSITDRIKSWRLNEHNKGRPNYALIDETEKILTGLNVRIHWIRGHNDNPHNEMADKLAKRGRELEQEIVV